MSYIPKERCDITGTIIIEKANWTNEEIIVWIDNEEKREQDEYNRQELEFLANSYKYIENRRQEIWARIQEEHVRESE